MLKLTKRPINLKAGQANGLATLGNDGKVPTAQLPPATAITFPIAVADGGTGATNPADARSNLGTASVNDARFTDQRTPTDGSVTLAKLAAGVAGQANGLATLGSDGKVPTAQLPPASAPGLLVPAVSTSTAVSVNWSNGDQLVRHEVTEDAMIAETSNKTPGTIIQVHIKNTSGSSINLIWPAWLIIGGALPTTLLPGQRVSVSVMCVSSTETEAVGGLVA